MGLLQKHWNSKSGTSINVIKLLMSFISRVFVLPFWSIPTCVRLDYHCCSGEEPALLDRTWESDGNPAFLCVWEESNNRLTKVHFVRSNWITSWVGVFEFWSIDSALITCLRLTLWLEQSFGVTRTRQNLLLYIFCPIILVPDLTLTFLNVRAIN